jgi:septal ring factor EnvC (AmiA/AmiB activator)
VFLFVAAKKGQYPEALVATHADTEGLVTRMLAAADVDRPDMFEVADMAMFCPAPSLSCAKMRDDIGKQTDKLGEKDEELNQLRDDLSIAKQQISEKDEEIKRLREELAKANEK